MWQHLGYPFLFKNNIKIILPSYYAKYYIAKFVNEFEAYICTLDILFSSNHNIHKSSCGLRFWALDPLINGFLVKSINQRV